MTDPRSIGFSFEPNMSVRNRINAFEAHNDELRKSSTLSPKSPSAVSPNNSFAVVSPRPPMHGASPLPPPSSSTPGASTLFPFKGNDSPDRPASETSMASQIRINRLQRQQSGGGGGGGGGGGSVEDADEQVRRKTNRLQARRLMGVPESSPASSTVAAHRRPLHPRSYGSSGDPPAGGPAVSLFSHRRPDSTYRSTGGDSQGGSTSHSARSPAPAQPSGQSTLSRKATELSRRRLLLQPRLNHDTGEGSDAEPVAAPGSVGRETAPTSYPQRPAPPAASSHAPPSTSTAPVALAAGRNNNNSRMGKIQRMKKMRNLDRHKSRDGLSTSSELDLHQLHPSSSAEQTNDCEDAAALASVRHLVGTSSVERNSRLSSPSDSLRNVPDDEKEEPAQTMDTSSHAKWIQDGEEKSDKAHPRRIVLARSSSSEYETEDGGYDDDDDENRGSPGPKASAAAILLRDQVLHGPSTSASQMTPDVAAFFDRRRRTGAARDLDDDDETDDYYSGREDNDPTRTYGIPTFESGKDEGEVDQDDDNDSQGSMSYFRRREKEAREQEELARQKAAAAAKAGMEKSWDNPFLPKEQVEEFRKKYDTPGIRTAVGVAAASTLGLVVLGPVGLLVGAATAGIGAGIMQIPEEQRSNMCVKASEAMHGAHQSAIICTEAISNSCANTYENSVADHVPSEMKTCCTAIDEEVNKVVSSSNGPDDGILDDPDDPDTVKRSDSQSKKTKESKPHVSPNRVRNKKDNVACLREGKNVLLPVSRCDCRCANLSTIL